MPDIVAVSGASGLLGGNLAALLLERGFRVRALRRATSGTSHLAHLPLEWCNTGFSDAEELAAAFRGVKAVFHCAGCTVQSRWLTPQLMAGNVLLSRTIAVACKLAGVPRLVHGSSTVTCGISSNAGPVDENSHRLAGHRWSADGYTVSKRTAENEMLAASSEIDVVIVNPGYMFGPLDGKPSSGRLILKIAASPVIGWPAGCNNFVDARDVAAGMIAACERGRRGERYILGGENLSYRVIAVLIANVAGRRAPAFAIPRTVARVAGWVGDAAELVSGSAQDINTSTVRYAYTEGFQFSSAKAARELGYRWRPVKEAITDAIAWFKERRALD